MASGPAAGPIGSDTLAAEGAALHQMWGGRFAADPETALVALNRSLPVDGRLWPQDVRVARVWVMALRLAGVLSTAEESTLLEGLGRVAERLADGAAVGAADEDVHTLVERLLYEEVGPLAGKLNSGRSRNDQIATDLRLWCREALETLDGEIAALGTALVARARAGIDLILPGYTHGQQAQPVRWAFVLLAHAWPLARDRGRLADVVERIAELPLGAGALAGSGVTVDRVFLKESLGFRRIAPNALDVTGDRDYVAEVLFLLSLVATHVSRLAGELMAYASSEYGFVRLADGYATGSSLLPQKRNPDVLELARAKSARVVTDLSGLLSLLRGLPAGYSKDLQEDKVFLFAAMDAVLLTLPAIRGAVETMAPVPERMAAALDPSLLATDLADGLVHAGVPFREAHGQVGRLVRLAEARGVDLTAVPAVEAARVHPELPRLLAGLGSWEQSVERRATPGGASRRSVLDQIEALERGFGDST